MAEQTRGPNEPVPAGEALDENKLIAERRAKLAAIREKGIAYPNDFRRTHYAGDLQKDHSAATAEELPLEASRNARISGHGWSASINC